MNTHIIIMNTYIIIMNTHISVVFLYTPLSCIGIMVRVFANGPADQVSIPGRIIPETQIMVLLCLTLSITR